MILPICRSQPSTAFRMPLIPFVDPSTGEPPAGGTYIAAPVELAGGHNLVVWVDVAVPVNARSGEYEGHYTVRAESFLNWIVTVDYHMLTDIWRIGYSPEQFTSEIQ